jgi:hypothetical protein
MVVCCRNQADYRWMLGRALPTRNARCAVDWHLPVFTSRAGHRHRAVRRGLSATTGSSPRANVIIVFIYTASHDRPSITLRGLLEVLRQEAAGLTESPSCGRAGA